MQKNKKEKQPVVISLNKAEELKNKVYRNLDKEKLKENTAFCGDNFNENLSEEQKKTNSEVASRETKKIFDQERVIHSETLRIRYSLQRHFCSDIATLLCNKTIECIKKVLFDNPNPYKIPYFVDNEFSVSPIVEPTPYSQSGAYWRGQIIEITKKDFEENVKHPLINPKTGRAEYHTGDFAKNRLRIMRKALAVTQDCIPEIPIPTDNKQRELIEKDRQEKYFEKTEKKALSPWVSIVEIDDKYRYAMPLQFIGEKINNYKNISYIFYLDGAFYPIDSYINSWILGEEQKVLYEKRLINEFVTYQEAMKFYMKKENLKVDRNDAYYQAILFFNIFQHEYWNHKFRKTKKGSGINFTKDSDIGYHCHINLKEIQDDYFSRGIMVKNGDDYKIQKTRMHKIWKILSKGCELYLGECLGIIDKLKHGGVIIPSMFDIKVIKATGSVKIFLKKDIDMTEKEIEKFWRP